MGKYKITKNENAFSWKTFLCTLSCFPIPQVHRYYVYFILAMHCVLLKAISVFGKFKIRTFLASLASLKLLPLW